MLERGDLLRGLTLVLLVIVTYAQVWHAGFIWDDDAHLTKNVCIVGPAGFKEIWTTAEATYYPLVLSTFWLLHKCFALNPLPYHLANVIAHAFATVLLWQVLRLLGVRGAWFGAALWGLHPVMVQSVAWITELKNTQSGVFYLLCIFAFVRSREPSAAARERWWLGAALLFCAMAIASKSSTVILPAVLALCLWWQQRRLGWRDLLGLWPFFAMAAAASGWTIWEQKYHSGAIGAEWSQSGPERLVIASSDLWFYLGKLAWPRPLIFIYPRWQIDASHIASYVPVAMALGAALWCWWQRNGRWRPIAFAAAYFVIALLPVLGFFDVFFFRYSFVSDHFQYLASMGPLALAASGLAGWFHSDARRRGAVIAVCTVWLLALGTFSWRQSTMYRDVPSLWQTTLARNGGAWIAHYELARAARERGDTDAAIIEYEKGLAVWPGYAAAHYNLASAYLEKGDARNAIAHYETALRLDPNDAETHNNLANVLKQQGENAVAITHYKEALKLRPDYAAAEYNLGDTLLITGDKDEALQHFRRAIDSAGTDPGLQLAVADRFLQLGLISDAVANYSAALQKWPDDVPGLTNLAWILATSSDGSIRDGDRALQLAQRAEKISGGTEPLVLHALAAAFAESGDFARAIETTERATALVTSQNDSNLAAALRAETELYRHGRPARSK
ncbi:MAG: tetratricopeptide repeat protein [Verrucomicrobiota bacterium]|nr:tetratricopeptide repeat protein [Verrucomicrobiota bacterium]